MDEEELPKTAPAEIASEEEEQEEEEEEEEEEDFEFAFSIESDPSASPDATADDIFFNGRILPVYPLFNRQLIPRSTIAYVDPKYDDKSSDSAASSSTAVLLSADTKPNNSPKSVQPKPCLKSSSTGSSSSRKWKLRDLVVGRSRSDGKERFVVFPLPEKDKKCVRRLKTTTTASADDQAEKKKERISSKGKEIDIVAAHRIYYGKDGSGGGGQHGSSRRSFLPYRQELLGGLFGNGKHHP